MATAIWVFHGCFVCFFYRRCSKGRLSCSCSPVWFCEAGVGTGGWVYFVKQTLYLSSRHVVMCVCTGGVPLDRLYIEPVHSSSTLPAFFYRWGWRAYEGLEAPLLKSLDEGSGDVAPLSYFACWCTYPPSPYQAFCLRRLFIAEVLFLLDVVSGTDSNVLRYIPWESKKQEHQRCFVCHCSSFPSGFRLFCGHFFPCV